MKDLKVRIKFVEEILGSANADKDVHSEFIASKAPDAPTREQEVEALGTDEVERKETTVFPRMEDGTPLIWAYQIRGFIKHALGACKTADTKGPSSKIKAHKKFVDNYIFVFDGTDFDDRRSKALPIKVNGEITSCQRPLRASTMQGERVALANSEAIPAGSTCEFVIRILKDDLEDAIEECLNYGRFNGLGQWRNAGKGSFTWEKLEDWKTVTK